MSSLLGSSLRPKTSQKKKSRTKKRSVWILPTSPALSLPAMCPRHPNPTTAESGPRPLETARITSLPPSAHYVPNFISEEEEQFIIEKVCALHLDSTPRIACANHGFFCRSEAHRSRGGEPYSIADYRLGRPILSEMRSSRHRSPLSWSYWFPASYICRKAMTS